MTAETEEIFVKVLIDSGLTTADKIEAARKAKASAGDQSLGDLLVKDGSLKPQIREAVENRVTTGHTGPLKKLGKYLLVRRLGEGAMGAVFLGLELEGDSEKRMALKVLKKELTQGNEALVERFMREASSALTLQHENIINAKGMGEEAGLHYYVMDYFDGEPLDAVLKRETKISFDRAVKIIIDAAKGLAYAHGLGFIHRDIKPANIYLTFNGPAKLLDFGLVKNVALPNQNALTVTGTVMGSPHFISPEQVRGEKNLDRRTDIYSLGATLFHMVCGRPPFQGNSPATVIMMHVSQPPPNPSTLSSDVPPGLSKIILTMMAKERDKRYPNCEKLLEDLIEVQAGREPKYCATLEAPSPSSEELMATCVMPPQELENTRLTAPNEAQTQKPKKRWWQFWKF